MELTVPILVAVIFAVVVGDRLSLSVFDALARFKNLPYFMTMPGISSSGSLQLRSEHAQCARELVVVDSPVMFQHSTTADLKELMSKKFDSNYVPILENSGRMFHLIPFVYAHAPTAWFSESNIVIAVSQKLQIQDYVHRKTSTGSESAIDRLRSRVIKDAEEINDSLLGIEMLSVEGSDGVDATSSSSAASSSLPTVVPADAVDFYSPNRLPVDVSFMEFEPHTPPAEILLQFQRLNLLCACPRSSCLLRQCCHSHSSQVRRGVRQGTVRRYHYTRGSCETIWFIYDLKT